MKTSYANLIYGCKIPRLFIVIIFTIEYLLVFNKVTFSAYGLLLLLIYVILTLLITCSNHGRNVYVRYEQELSIVLKNVVVAAIMFIILSCIRLAIVQQLSLYESNVLETYVNYGDVNDFGAVRSNYLLASVSTLDIIICLLLLCAIQTATFLVMNAVVGFFQRKNAIYRRLYICGNDDIDISAIPGAEKIKLWESDIKQCINVVKDASEIYLYDISATQRNDLLKECYRYNKPVFFSVKLSDVEIRAAKVAQDAEEPLFYIAGHGMGKRGAFLKRAFDVLFAVVFLCITSPVLVVTAICIKKEDAGPVFYKQRRCTKDMREFDILKFRSMKTSACEVGDNAEYTLTDVNDERITKVGKTIRKYKIDELPQLINILKGDMSFVGPRPERPELIKQCLEEIPEFAFRNTVKAGLTGYAQVHGNYHIRFLEKLKWDLMYIENYSLLLDFKIILMTIPVVFKGDNV